jgi:hypothetical protein
LVKCPENNGSLMSREVVYERVLDAKEALLASEAI